MISTILDTILAAILLGAADTGAQSTSFRFRLQSRRIVRLKRILISKGGWFKLATFLHDPRKYFLHSVVWSYRGSRSMLCLVSMNQNGCDGFSFIFSAIFFSALDCFLSRIMERAYTILYWPGDAIVNAADICWRSMKC